MVMLVYYVAVAHSLQLSVVEVSMNVKSYIGLLLSVSLFATKLQREKTEKIYKSEKKHVIEI